jgi:hypothetical protein
MEFLNRNNAEKENQNKINKNLNQQKSNVNKSMDSKRLLSKGNNSNTNNNNNNTKNNIIHLSNLNNYSYATDKYICYYENKRDTNIVKSNNNTNNNTNNNKNTNNNNNNKIYNTNKTNNNNSKILNNSKLINNSSINNNSRINNNRANTKKNILNKKEQNKNINSNTNINVNTNSNNNNANSENPILFTKKYPKKETNKYPLRINYTNDNINNALESESILEFNEEKENDKDFSSKRDSKKVSNTYKYNSNSYINNNEDNNKNRKYNNNNNNNNENVNKIKHYYNTERVSTNDFYGNKSLNKNNERNDDDQNINNLYDNGEKKDLKDKNENLVSLEAKTEKREIKIGNNIPKKVNYTTNHDYLSFNPTKNEKKNNILKIKNNDQLMIINHNKKSSLGSNGITEGKKDRNYKISSNVVNEHILRDSFTDKELSSSEEENILRISMQSLNDSKIMEIANRYITDEENLDRNEINEILNSKKEKN